MEIDDYDDQAVEFMNRHIIGPDQIAAFGRRCASRALFHANKIYQESGVSPHHVGMIEVSRVAIELKKRAGV